MDARRRQLIADIERLLAKQPQTSYFIRVYDCLPNGERVLLSEDAITDTGTTENINVEIIYNKGQISNGAN